MANNISCERVDTKDQWTISVLQPPLNATQSSVFEYSITRPLDENRPSQMSNISMCFCPDIPSLSIVNCYLEITYANIENPSDPEITKVFEDACIVEDTPPGSPCARILKFDSIPSGDEVPDLPDNYEQKEIKLFFELNQSLGVGPLEIDFKTGDSESTWNVCGYSCEIVPPPPSRGIIFN